MAYSLEATRSELHYLLLSTIAIMSLIGYLCYYQKMYISMLFLLPLLVFVILGYLSIYTLKKNTILYAFGATQYIIISTIFITVSEILNLKSKSECEDFQCEILNIRYLVLAVNVILSIVVSLFGHRILVKIRRASMRDTWAKCKKEFELKNSIELNKDS